MRGQVRSLTLQSPPPCHSTPPPSVIATASLRAHDATAVTANVCVTGTNSPRSATLTTLATLATLATLTTVTTLATVTTLTTPGRER